jgi:PIN domain nuclease of toxin-antitoxin system
VGLGGTLPPRSGGYRGSTQPGEGLRREIDDAIRSADQVCVSAVSGWEIAIKVSLGRLRTTRRVEDVAADSGLGELPLRLRHVQRAMTLLRHHRDPVRPHTRDHGPGEGVTLVTRDAMDDHAPSLMASEASSGDEPWPDRGAAIATVRAAASAVVVIFIQPPAFGVCRRIGPLHMM